ncbi:MAG: hypothetical protein KF845_12750 [Cyclobacteriaceae bacterium]|nr:hypothetical protein [Cyclobacteriaceae bacterium]
MKKVLLLLLLASAFICSCDNVEVDEEKFRRELQARKINEIIPQQYIDILKTLGMEINEGMNPPNVEGSYKVSPHRVFASNDGFLIPGTYLDPMFFQFSDQKEFNFSIRVNDSYAETIKGIISGEGNQFTVYALMAHDDGNMTGQYIWAHVFSGTMQNGVIKDLKAGTISVGDLPFGTPGYLRKGEAYITYDSDSETERVEDFGN